MGDGECVVSSLLLVLTISPLPPPPFSSFRSPLDPRASRSSCPLHKVSPCLALFFEYNLQTPLNARSRFKPPGTRRPLLYQSVKISRPARELESRAYHPLITPAPFVSIYPPYEILTAGCLRVFRRPASSTPRVLQQFVSQLFRNSVVIKLLNALCLLLEESALDMWRYDCSAVMGFIVL